MGNSTASAAAEAAMADIFTGMLMGGGPTFASFERGARAPGRGLFDLGVKPAGEVEAAEVCVEADGTWVALQGTGPGGPSKVEIKAMVAYSGKAGRGRKVARGHRVSHGCAASPGDFWPEAVAAIGSEFDLSALERVHLGTDGEGWCKRGGAYFPLRVEVTGHLDPFHVDRALLSCFDEPAMGWQLVEAVRDGGEEAAASLLEACIGMGLARKGAPPRAGLPAQQRRHNRRGRSLPRHHGVGEPAPVQVPHGVGALRLVARGRLRHGAPAQPEGLRARRAAQDPGGIRHAAEAAEGRGAADGGAGTGRPHGQGLPAARGERIRAAQGVRGRALRRGALCCRRRLRDGRNGPVGDRGDAAPIKVTPSRGYAMLDTFPWQTI